MLQDRKAPLALGLALGLTLSVVFAGGFAIGMAVQSSRTDASLHSSDSHLNDFMTAYHLVTERSYFRPFNRNQLIEAAIDGMLSVTGDPHTVFLSPQENQVANTELNGANFTGIGAIVGPYHGYLQILAPLPAAPAADAGLQSGDIVTRIDGQAVRGMTSSAAIARIHGSPGTTVHLTVLRSGRSTFTVTVHRARIPPITAYGRPLSHHIGYIQVSSFGDTTAGEVSRALTYVKSQHARALILDLRQNPGGYVDAAQRVVSQFISHGAVAYEEVPNKRVQVLPVVASSHVTNLPMVILVDSGTASAAEITAAALRDNGRAVLIGTQTYGKGSMQTVYSLSDGSSIRITDRFWLTPHKRSIQKRGIHPNIVVASGPVEPGSANDPQLLAAEHYLQAHAGL